MKLEITPYIVLEDGSEARGGTIVVNVGLIADRSKLINTTEYDAMLTNGFYLHGRAGIFNEVEYFDENPLNNITPTK